MFALIGQNPPPFFLAEKRLHSTICERERLCVSYVTGNYAMCNLLPSHISSHRLWAAN